MNFCILMIFRNAKITKSLSKIPIKTIDGAFVITGQYRNCPFAAYAQKRLRPIMTAIKKYYSNKFKK